MTILLMLKGINNICAKWNFTDSILPSNIVNVLINLWIDLGPIKIFCYVGSEKSGATIV